MYVDDGSGHDDDSSIKVDVDGQEYAAEANVDLNDDGINDAIAIQTDSGTTVYEDSDHDGVADEYAELDSQGHVLEQGAYDNGHWDIHAGGGSSDGGQGSQANTGSGADIHVDSPKGDVDAGKATVDSDGDGKADTAVADDGQGDKILATDTNGDGSADVLTEVDKNGEVTISQHTGHGQWTVEEHGHIDSSGHYTPDSGGSHGLASVDAASDAAWGAASGDSQDGVAHIDSATGQWISRN